MDGSIGKLLDVVAQRPVLGLFGLAGGGALFLFSLPTPLGISLADDAVLIGISVGAIVYLSAGAAAGLFAGWLISATRNLVEKIADAAQKRKAREERDEAQKQRHSDLSRRIAALSPDAKYTLNLGILIAGDGTRMLNDVDARVGLELEQNHFGRRFGPMFSLKQEIYDLVLNNPELVSSRR